MKVAMYIEDGSAQLALTAESDYEKAALKAFESATLNGIVTKRGGFYACAGGWTRQTSGKSDESLMLVAMKPD